MQQLSIKAIVQVKIQLSRLADKLFKTHILVCCRSVKKIKLAHPVVDNIAVNLAKIDIIKYAREKQKIRYFMR
jgi:hypothetical protein